MYCDTLKSEQSSIPAEIVKIYRMYLLDEAEAFNILSYVMSLCMT